MNEYLEQILLSSLAQFELEESPKIMLEAPKVASHGDASTNIAMLLAKPLRNNPRAIAQLIVEGLEYDEKKISSVEIAGPGFINFRFAEDYLYDELASVIETGEKFGKTTTNQGKKVQIEFVSANPTGPLTVGHGRNAVLGDTVARLMEWTGAEVDREYYFNDAGRQMRVLGQSVQTRYLEQLGHEITFPEGGYEGEYIKDIATELIKEKGSKLAETDDWTPFKEKAEEEIFADISNTLEKMKINMDSFFNEHSLYEKGDIDSVVSRLREKGLVYEAEGATWFKTTEFGKEKDTSLNVTPPSILLNKIFEFET